MDSILFWSLILVASGLVIYFFHYKNMRIIQKSQREGLQKLDNIIDLLNKKKK
jgi:hypothetical protein